MHFFLWPHEFCSGKADSEDPRHECEDQILEYGNAHAEHKEVNKDNVNDISLPDLCEFAKKEMEAKQQKLLNDFRVHFDNFYSELDLHKSGKVENRVKELKDKEMS